MSISRFVWSEMQKHFQKIEQAISDGKELKLELLAAKHLILNKFYLNGLWYIGVHDLTPSGTIISMSGMNFEQEEWNKLVASADDINSSLKGDNPEYSAVKRDSNGKEVVHDILMYRWSWCVGKKKISESDVFFFTEEDCCEDGLMNKPNKEKAAITVETVWGPPPPKYVHMHLVFMCLLKNHIQSLVRQNCQGCNTD